MKKKVLILSTYQGHASIARAVRQALEKANYAVNIYEQEDPSIHLYRLIYRHKPEFFKHLYNVGKLKSSRIISKMFLKQNYDAKIKELLEKHKPDLIITTFFIYLPSLELNKSVHQPIINIIVNPRDVLDIELSSKITANCAFDDKQMRMIKKNNVKYNNILKTGWFVRDEFEESYSKSKVREKLKLDQKKPTFLFTSGSEGTNAIIANIILLLKSRKECQIIVACGTNEILFKGIKALKPMAVKGVQKIIPIAFTTKLYQYMQAADLVIGKAGPNSVFECVATKTPFFATTHISGQEDGNLEIIKSYKLGYVEEEPTKAIKLMEKILDHPEVLNEFKPALKLLADQNKAAKKKLREIVKEALDNNN